MTDLDKYSKYHTRFYRKRAMSAADFNALYGTHLNPFSTQTLRAYNAARVRFKGKTNIHDFLGGGTRTPIAAMSETPIAAMSETPIAAVSETPIAAVSETPIAATSETPIAAMSETPIAAVSDACSGCGNKHEGPCVGALDACSGCGNKHEGPCVGALLDSMKTPEVKVKKQVEFYDVWKAWVDLEQTGGFSSDEIKDMAFIHTNPPLGFDTNDEDAVQDFILDNTFFKRNMHREEIEFLNGHTEHGSDLRSVVINLEKMNLSEDVPALLHLKA